MHNLYNHYACNAFTAIRPELARCLRRLGGRADDYRRGLQAVSEPTGGEPRAATAARDV